MSTRLDSSNYLGPTVWWRNLSLQWPIGLLVAGLIPFLLPIETSPATLAAFALVILGLVVLARSWLIAALPVLATIGPHCLPIAAFGVSIFGFRLLLMLVAVFSTPLTTRAKWWYNPVARWAIFFGAFWLLYALLSLFWAPNLGRGLGEVVIIVFGFALILALLSLEAYRPDNLDKLRFGWLIAFLLAAVVAWIEILTDQHLPTPRAEHNIDYFADSKIVSTLSHTSNFGGFLLLVIPFLMWSMEQTKGVAKLAYITLIGAVGHLMFYTASRMGLLGLIAQLVVYVTILNRRWYAVLLLALGGLVAFGYWSYVASHGEFAMARKLSNVYETGTDTSMDHRVALTLNGLYMVYKTAGRGVGAAGFEENISGEDLLVPLPILRFGARWNAHNFWIEILSQYGVLPFSAFVALLGWAGLLGWRGQRRPGDLGPVVGRSLLVALVGYVFYGAAGGTPMEQPTHWMFLGSIIVLAAFLHDELGSKPAAQASMPPPPRNSSLAGQSAGPP
jgi:teichuronic acid biosynthesis protein TuaE